MMKNNVGNLKLPDFGECTLYVTDYDYGQYNEVILRGAGKDVSIDLVNLRYVNGCTNYLSCNDLEVFEDYMRAPATSFKNRWMNILFQNLLLKCKPDDMNDIILIRNKVFEYSKPDFRLLKFNEGYKLHCGFLKLSGWGNCEIYMIGGIYNVDEQKPYIFIESIYGEYKTALYINKPEYYLSTILVNQQLLEFDSFLDEKDESGYSNWYNITTSWQSSNTDDDDFNDIEKPDYTTLIKEEL